MTRHLDLEDGDPRVSPHGGPIALGCWKRAVGLADMLVDALAAQDLKGITFIANNAGGDSATCPG